MTPDIHLRTLFVLDEHGRIRSTREPKPTLGPLFTLVRGTSSCVWAVREDVPADLAVELGRLAAEEQPLRNPQNPPLHADTYLSLVGGRIASGPAFLFPDEMRSSSDVTVVEDVRLLEHNFQGWTAGEVPERSPIVAVLEGGHPVSICFSARSTATAAEAGVETAVAFRGCGLAPRVTAAWAAAIRASGRVPLYSTSWRNKESLAVARKLDLPQYASDWGLVGNLA